MLPDSVFGAIVKLLQQRIGLDPVALPPRLLASAIHRRMGAAGLSDGSAYLISLQRNDRELEALIEDVVVPETWFFRDREPFRFLLRHIQTEWIPQHSQQVLRVLSAPCATGEEPYSIAIALMEAGLLPNQFHIDAIDISKPAIAKAKQAFYLPYSFRGNAFSWPLSAESSDRSLRHRYFDPRGTGYQVKSAITQTVSFLEENLLAPVFLTHQAPYDLIFCRNLLIYLTPYAKAQVLRTIDRLLVDHGLLFVGHSELGQLSREHFTPIPYPLAFVARKHRLQSPIAPLVSPPKPQSPIVPPPRPQPKPTAAPVADKPSPPPDSLLLSAHHLADRGYLKEALHLCQRHLNQHPTDADAHLLLGQIHQAHGQEIQAEQAFHKVLYLQPQSEAALMHLILLKEQQGNSEQVHLLRQRLQRLSPPNPSNSSPVSPTIASGHDDRDFQS